MSEGRRSCPGAREAGRREERRPRAAPGSRSARLAARFALRGVAAIRGRARACVCRVATSGGTWTACACVCASPPSEVVKRWHRRAREGSFVGAVGSRVAGDSFPVALLGVAAGVDPRVVRLAGRACDGWRPRGPAEPWEPRPGQLPAAAGKLVFSSLIVTEMGAAGEEAPACQRPCCCVCRVCDCVSVCVCFFLWGVSLLLLLPW